jgi:hypothetical protein
LPLDGTFGHTTCPRFKVRIWLENGNGFRTGLGLGNQKDQYLIDKISCIIYISVVIEVIGTDDFEEWYGALDDRHRTSVRRVVDVLEQQGLALGFPYSSEVKGSRYPMRELRAKSSGRYLRVFFAFDPTRNAVLLLGGDKTGNKRFYEQYIPRAEKLWEDYLAETGQRT